MAHHRSFQATPLPYYWIRGQVQCRHAQPVTFTTSLFTEKLRRNTKAWRPLGYIHDILSFTAARQANYADGASIQIHHKQLEAIFESFADSETRLQNVWLPLGSRGLCCVDIICPLLMMLTDNEEADKLAGRFGSYG